MGEASLDAKKEAFDMQLDKVMDTTFEVAKPLLQAAIDNGDLTTFWNRWWAVVEGAVIQLIGASTTPTRGTSEDVTILSLLSSVASQGLDPTSMTALPTPMPGSTLLPPTCTGAGTSLPI